MATQYFCKNEKRRQAVREATDVNGKPLLNGIDYLEVDPDDQKTLKIYFIHNLPGSADNPVPTAPVSLTKDNIVIEGGVRVRNVQIDKEPVTDKNTLTVTVNEAGDFSLYRLRLISSPSDPVVPDGFDQQLSEIEFSFKAACPSDFDCAPRRECPPEKLPEPRIDYLAKDYSSFRQLMLDRLSALTPGWKERNPADLQVALVELLAYVGDHLSYQQDAVATEAYIGTARRRVSVKRHARLVDYCMDDGCNARVWVQIAVNADNVSVPKGTKLFTRIPGVKPSLIFGSQEYDQAMREQPEVFETMHDVSLYEKHNDMRFYTWSDSQCCLPKGSTKASLEGNFPNLRRGDVLILEEMLGPSTGEGTDADLRHRQAVRLTAVNSKDKNEQILKDNLTGREVTEIEWAEADALQFPLCLSTEKADAVSRARGNIVLADHGDSTDEQNQGRKTGAAQPQSKVSNRNDGDSATLLPRSYRPQIGKGPLTQAASLLRIRIVNGVRFSERMAFDPNAAACLAFVWKKEDVMPSITLSMDDGTWYPQRDLLDSDKFSKHFVVEIETDGTAFLRFGDGEHGLRPDPGTVSSARYRYRVGNGVRGNVGSETIAHIACSAAAGAIVGVRNPLPASGGKDPETIEEARLFAPHAFRTQERAVTEADYAEVAQRHPDVQRAVATFRWTGSWYTGFITIDRKGGKMVDAVFKEEMRAHLEKYRMAGHDIEIEDATPAGLDVAMNICAKPGYFRSDVKQALLEAFSNRQTAGGERGLFHPDNFTFGQPVYLSKLYQAASQVAGVESAEITRFQRWGRDPSGEIGDGLIKIGRTEVARLDNDPDFPQYGKMEFYMKGGM